jgi:hypothetical protein
MSHELNQPPKLTRSRFLPDEDALLRTLVSTYGTHSWEEIAKRIPGRNVRQCRDRWFHYLGDLPTRYSWSVEEDALLRRIIDRFNGSFEHVMAFFPNQTSQEIQRRWVLLKHKKSSEEQRTIVTEEVRTPEQMTRKREPMEFEIAQEFEEVSTFGFGENSVCDWDE